MPPGAVPEDRLSTIQITPFVSALLLLFFLGRREPAFLRPPHRTGSALLPFGSLVLVNAMLHAFAGGKWQRFAPVVAGVHLHS